VGTKPKKYAGTLPLAPPQKLAKIARASKDDAER
jgi:hypothetical protein